MTLRRSSAPCFGAVFVGLWAIFYIGLAEPARADCVQNGTTVTCSGASPGGFSTPDSGLNVTVLSGANVGDTINLNDNNTVLNLGIVSVPSSSGFAIVGQLNNNIVNSGIVIAGDGVVGLAAGGNSTITNNGSVTVGAGGQAISAGVSNTVTNNGSVTVLGSTGTGIDVSDNTTVINRGSITVGFNGFGIVGTTGNTITNSGSIMAGDSGVGISVAGSANIINNSSIRVGEGGFGIVAINDNNTVVNNGTITGGSDAFGVLLQGNSGLVVNTGTISVGACGAGIDVSSGSGNRVVNSGRILGSGCGATGVILGDQGGLVNSGVISMPETGFSILGGGNATVTNTGTLDGPIFLNNGGNALTNSGLITVSAPWTGTGVNHFIDGTFTQTASGTLALRISPDNCCGFDTLTASGTAALGGTLRALVQPGLYGTRTVYSGALQFAAMTGGFASVQSSSVFLNASAIYNPDSVDLVLTRIPFNQAGGGANGQAIGNLLEANYSTSLSGAAATFYSNLLASSAPNTLSQLTGEITTAGQSTAFSGLSQFLGVLFGQTGAVRAGPQTALRSTTQGGGTRLSLVDAESCGDACAGTAFRRVTAWAQGFGSAGSTDRDLSQGSSRVDTTLGGGGTGIDVQLDQNFLVGFTLGAASAGYSLTDLNSYGSWRAVLLGLYGGYTSGPAYVDAALGYGYGSFDTTRSVGTGTLSERITGQTDAWQLGGRVEAGWRIAFDQHSFTPFAGLTVQSLRQNGYSESSVNTATGGPGVLGLSVQPQTATSVRSLLGGQVSTSIRLQEAIVNPRLRLGWAHEFNTDRSTTASLSTVLPGSNFTVFGARPASDALVMTAGIDIDLSRAVRIFAQFDGDFAATARSYSGTGGIRLIW